MNNELLNQLYNDVNNFNQYNNLEEDDLYFYDNLDEMIDKFCIFYLRGILEGMLINNKYENVKRIKEEYYNYINDKDTIAVLIMKFQTIVYEVLGTTDDEE